MSMNILFVLTEASIVICEIVNLMTFIRKVHCNFFT